MLHIPALRLGKPYNSLEKTSLVHHVTGEPVAEVSQVNGGLIARDLNKVAAARRELHCAGLLEEDSTRPTPAAHRRRREFLPHRGPLSRAAVARFRRHLAGDRDVTDANRAAYRELAAAGLMAAGHSFAGGDESIYRLTRHRFERKAEILAGAKEAG